LCYFFCDILIPFNFEDDYEKAKEIYDRAFPELTAEQIDQIDRS